MIILENLLRVIADPDIRAKTKEQQVKEIINSMKRMPDLYDLSKQEFHPHVIESYGEKIVLEAIKHSQIGIVKLLLEAHLCPEQANLGAKALFRAAHDGEYEITKLLLEAKATPDIAADRHKITPLMRAAAMPTGLFADVDSEGKTVVPNKCAYQDIVNLLIIDAKANLELQDAFHKTALGSAVKGALDAQHQSLATISVLLSHGAKIYDVDKLYQLIFESDPREPEMLITLIKFCEQMRSSLNPSSNSFLKQSGCYLEILKQQTSHHKALLNQTLTVTLGNSLPKEILKIFAEYDAPLERLKLGVFKQELVILLNPPIDQAAESKTNKQRRQCSLM